MTTTSMELEKVRKNLLKVKNVFKVTKIVALVLTILLFICAVAVEIFGHDTIIISSNDAGNLSFVFKVFNFKLTNVLSDGIGKHLVAGYSFGFGIVLGIMAIIFEFIESIFKTIVEGESLFTENALKKMKTGFILFAILTFFETSIFTTVFLSLILWSIYTLFKYACVLQKESDETL